MEEQRKCYVCSKRIAVEGQSMCLRCRKKYNADRWEKRKPIIDKYLGTQCVLCGDTRYERLRCHDITQLAGQPRHRDLCSTSLAVVEENCKSGKFVRVCARCHGKSYALMDEGFTWEEIQVEIKKFLKSLPKYEKQLLAWHRWKRKHYGE